MKKRIVICDDPMCDTEDTGDKFVKVELNTSPDAPMQSLDICHDHEYHSRGVIEIYFGEEGDIVMVSDRIHYYRGETLQEREEFLAAINRAIVFMGIEVNSNA